jgi:hypothetical protein
MRTPWLSVVIPTIGRDSLEHTIASLDAQPESAGLEVLVVADTFGGTTPALERAREKIQASRHHWVEYDAGFHMVGQPQRTYGAHLASAPWVWFSQDDNIAAEDALASIEMVIDNETKRRPLFFRFRSFWGELLWREPYLALGNIDADCLVFPRPIAQNVQWGLRYEGDFDAARAAFQLARGDVAWVDQIISIARPGESDYWWLTS